MRAPLLRRTSTLIVACGLMLGFPAMAKETLIFAHLYTESSPQHQNLLEADKELMERSGGKIGLDIKPRGLLGDQDSRLIDAVHFGQADMAFVGGPFAAQDYAPIGVVSAPFAFRDFTHWQHFKSSALAQELEVGYNKSNNNIMVIGYYYNGIRHINSKNPIRTPDDIFGLRVRVPNAPLYLQLFRALGATPVPWPYLRTYDAIKQGTVDAEENPLTTIEDGKFYQVAPFITLTGHMTDTGIIILNAKHMGNLQSDEQALLREVFDKLSDRLSEQIHVKEMEDMGFLQKNGVTFIPIDRAPLTAKVEAMVQGSSFAWSGDLYNRLQTIP